MACSVADTDNLDRNKGSSIQVAKDCFVITAKVKKVLKNVLQKSSQSLL